MKIAVCANTSWYVYNFRKNFLRALAQAGHCVSVIAPADAYSPTFAEMGIPWFPLAMRPMGLNPLREWRVIAQLARHLRTIAPDLIFTYTIKCNVYAGVLRRLLPFRHVATVSGLGQSFDGRYRRRWAARAYALALRPAQMVFFQNHEDYARFTQPFMLSRAQCRRVPGSGVNLEEFTPLEQGEPHQPRRFLMLGRLVPQKGYDLFLEAARIMRCEHPGQAEFSILGIADAGRKDSAELLQRIRTCQAQGLVTFLPEVADVRPILRQTDVVVLPSRYHEGVPRSLLEALACGKPVITTDWKGCRDTVEHGGNGLLVAPGDAPALAAAVRMLSALPADRLREMGRNSRQKAEQEFDERLVMAAYLAELDRQREHHPGIPKGRTPS